MADVNLTYHAETKQVLKRSMDKYNIQMTKPSIVDSIVDESTGKRTQGQFKGSRQQACSLHHSVHRNWWKLYLRHVEAKAEHCGNESKTLRWKHSSSRRSKEMPWHTFKQRKKSICYSLSKNFPQKVIETFVFVLARFWTCAIFFVRFWSLRFLFTRLSPRARKKLSRC